MRYLGSAFRRLAARVVGHFTVHGNAHQYKVGESMITSPTRSGMGVGSVVPSIYLGKEGEKDVFLSMESSLDRMFQELEQEKQERRVLENFIRSIGLDPARISRDFGLGSGDFVCKEECLRAIRISWDWSHTHFSPKGIEEGEKWLESLRHKARSSGAK